MLTCTRVAVLGFCCKNKTAAHPFLRGPTVHGGLGLRSSALHCRRIIMASGRQSHIHCQSSLLLPQQPERHPSLSMMKTMDDSVHSSSSSSSESEMSDPRAKNDEDRGSSKIRASKKVSCWRAVVMVTLFCTAVLVVTVTPIMIAKEEQAVFRIEVSGDLE